MGWHVRHRLSDLNQEVQRPKREGEEVEHRTRRLKQEKLYLFELDPTFGSTLDHFLDQPTDDAAVFESGHSGGVILRPPSRYIGVRQLLASRGSSVLPCTMQPSMVIFQPSQGPCWSHKLKVY